MVMKPLSPPDSHHLKAAEGWLELGNHLEANEELEKVAPLLRTHPDVLEMRWQIYATAGHWRASLEIARALIKLAPARPNGWIHLAYSSRRVKGGGLEAAWEALLPAMAKFPMVSVIPYNLACYAAQMNRLDEARNWWHKALEISQKTGEIDQIRLMALDDVDLEPIRKEIKSKGE
jgi:tetratricopeptide (TPR) repeat protein